MCLHSRYYLVITRFWELLIGCILAWAPWEWVKDFNKRPAWASEILSLAGVILIMIAIAKTTKKMMFPGYIALLPTIGTALVMMAGPETKINKSVSSLWLSNEYPRSLFVMLF